MIAAGTWKIWHIGSAHPPGGPCAQRQGIGECRALRHGQRSRGHESLAPRVNRQIETFPFLPSLIKSMPLSEFPRSGLSNIRHLIVTPQANALGQEVNE